LVASAAVACLSIVKRIIDPILFRDFDSTMLAVRCLLAILCGGILVVVAITALLPR
jgi:hypothetical protein